MRVFLLSIIVFLSSNSIAQSISIDANQFYQINSFNGLSSDFTTQCIKDKQGFVWISTTNGLNRYDGHNIKS